MIAAGVVGAVILGFVQDKTIDTKLESYDQQNATTMHTAFATETKTSIFGDYQALDMVKVEEASEEVQVQLKVIQEVAKKEALKIVALFPAFLLLAYLLLMFYFKSKGGYRIVLLDEDGKKHETKRDDRIAE